MLTYLSLYAVLEEAGFTRCFDKEHGNWVYGSHALFDSVNAIDVSVLDEEDEDFIRLRSMFYTEDLCLGNTTPPCRVGFRYYVEQTSSIHMHRRTPPDLVRGLVELKRLEWSKALARFTGFRAGTAAHVMEVFPDAEVCVVSFRRLRWDDQTDYMDYDIDIEAVEGGTTILYNMRLGHLPQRCRTDIVLPVDDDNLDRMKRVVAVCDRLDRL